MLQLRGRWGHTRECSMFISWCLTDYIYTPHHTTLAVMLCWLANLSSHWLAVFAGPAPGNVSLHPSYVSWLQPGAGAGATCLLSHKPLHPWLMGCGDSGHFLHAVTTAEVHKHSVRRISDRILNDCNADSFKSYTVRLNCLINCP